MGTSLLMYSSEYFEHTGVKFWTVVERILIVLSGEYPGEPSSITARILQVILLLSSTLIVSAIIGKFSATFVLKSLIGRKKMQLYKNFVVICNWNQKALYIISELLQSDKELQIVVAHGSELKKEEEYFEGNNESRVHFQNCDPMRYEVLRELNVLNAKSVILLSDDGVENPDDKNALIALAITHLENDVDGTKTKNVYVVVELNDVERRQHLKDAGADEIICSTDYTAGIIAQSAIYNQMSEIYERLLSYSQETNEIYFVKGDGHWENTNKRSANYPAHFIGKTFPELVDEINRIYSNTKNPILLIGVKRGDQILLNPQRNRFQQLESGDDLIVFSYKRISTIG